MDSFSVTSSGDRGIAGAASIQVGLGAGGFGGVGVTKTKLPDVLFAACSEGLKPGALEVRCKVWKGVLFMMQLANMVRNLLVQVL